MDQIESRTVGDEIVKARIPVEELLCRAVSMASAVNQFHREGRVHARLSPASFLLTPAGVELAEPDLGRSGVTAYTAPEQLRDVNDARSDIFATGAILYELATGSKAFGGHTEDELRTAIREKQPPPILTFYQDSPAADVYAALDRVVTGCLVKNPDQRRQRMQNVLVDLKLIARSAARPLRKPAPARISPPLQTALKPLEPRISDSAAHPAVPDPEAVPFQAPPVSNLAQTGSAPPRLPSVPEPAPLSIEPVMPAMVPAPPAPVPYRQFEPHVPDTNALPAPATGDSAESSGAILSQVSQPAPDAVEDTEVRVLTSGRGNRNLVRSFKVAAVLGIAAVLALTGMATNAYLRRPTHPPGGGRFALPAPEQVSYLGSPEISPDGQLIAFSAAGADKKQVLWIRRVDSAAAEPLAGTNDAVAPFWSPDSRFIAFFAGHQLKKIPVSGGPPVVLCPTGGLGGGGTWNRDGVIVFGRGLSDSLYRVPASGGTPESLTRLDSTRGDRGHLWPRFLPDGRHFLFYARRDADDASGISIGSLDNRQIQSLTTADSNALYAETSTSSSLARHGYLLFARGSRLTAQRFDPAKLAFQGKPFTVAEDIGYVKFVNLLPISAADNGLLAYQGMDEPKRQLVWFDRAGNRVGVLGDPGEYGQARISPDGKRVAVNLLSANQETADIWVFDLDRNRQDQLTSESTHEGSPVWSPAGDSIAYFSNPNGHFDLYRKTLRESAKPELLASSGEDKYPNDFSADGKYLLFGSIGPGTNQDIWILPLRVPGGRKPMVYLQTVSSEGYAAFSADKKWIAYQSDESGRAEVYVEPFPRAAGKSQRSQISTHGGGLPKWRADGQELYYITGNGELMAVSLGTAGALKASPPRTLFQTRSLPRSWNTFDVTAAGSRFLVNIPLEWASSQPVMLIANWTEGFKK
jgi:Tol biopolymer transport system component